MIVHVWPPEVLDGDVVFTVCGLTYDYLMAVGEPFGVIPVGEECPEANTPCEECFAQA